MRNNAGITVASTRTGVGQGDPWGSFFFELAIQPSLLRAQEALKNIEIEMELHIPGRKGIVIAFEDDTSAMGDTRAIVCLAIDIFAQDGFHVKVTKSTITGSDIETIAMIDPVPDGFRLSTQGTTMFGVPIGNREYRRQMAQRKLSNMHSGGAALQVVGPSLLLQDCYFSPPAVHQSSPPFHDVIRFKPG